jgi:replicative DNA helicase
MRVVSPFPEDRLPPQSVEAEQGVLGACLLDDSVIDDVIAILNPEDFWRDDNAIIYKAIRDLKTAGRHVDAILVDEELKRRGVFDRVGGLDTLTDLANSVPHAANAKYHAEIVRQKSITRRLIASAREIIEDGYSNKYTADEVLERAEKSILEIGMSAASASGAVLISDPTALPAAMDRIEARSKMEPGQILGLTTGLAGLDKIMHGLKPGEITIVAGRPSMGKTSLALNIAEHVALSWGGGVLIVTLEMDRLALSERSLISQSGVYGNKVQDGNLTPMDWKQLGGAYDTLMTCGRLWIDDAPSRSMSKIAANARRTTKKNGIRLMVIDYLQLIDCEDGSRDNRQEQISKVSRRMKIMSREIGVPVMVVSQLNRGNESREDKRPRMSDLRESGAIEQDADNILLIHRPDYYDANDQPGVVDLIVAKNRNGATGPVKLFFDKPLMRFKDFEEPTPNF